MAKGHFLLSKSWSCFPFFIFWCCVQWTGGLGPDTCCPKGETSPLWSLKPWCGWRGCRGQSEPRWSGCARVLVAAAVLTVVIFLSARCVFSSCCPSSRSRWSACALEGSPGGSRWPWWTTIPPLLLSAARCCPSWTTPACIRYQLVMSIHDLLIDSNKLTVVTLFQISCSSSLYFVLVTKAKI